MKKTVENEHAELTYLLDGHGWGTCLLHVDQKIYLLNPTYIFGDPLEILFRSLTVLLDGAPAVGFSWYDEPGEYKWILARDPQQQHRVNVSVSDCQEMNWEGNSKAIDVRFNV